MTWQITQPWIEVTLRGERNGDDGRRMLINTAHIADVLEDGDPVKTDGRHKKMEHYTVIQMAGGEDAECYGVEQTYDEIMKRLGLAIAPRAETFMMP